MMKKIRKQFLTLGKKYVFTKVILRCGLVAQLDRATAF